MRNSDAEVDRALDALRSRGWSGSDQNTAVEHRIKELTMSQTKGHMTKRLMIGMIAGVALGGGAVTAGVVHYANQRATIVLDTGEQFDVELDVNGSGTWVSDDGTEIQIQSVQGEDGEKQVTVEMTGDSDAGATVTIEDDADSDGDN